MTRELIALVALAPMVDVVVDVQSTRPMVGHDLHHLEFLSRFDRPAC